MLRNLVETYELTKCYGARTVLDRVDLTVREGEVYGLLGPNGAGKTTLLRILLGLVRPTGGRANVLDLSPGNPAALARLGMLVESPAFYPYLSGRDNLRTFARHARVRDARVDEVLEITGLYDRAGDRYTSYSLGMKQRLGVAAALLKQPRLLILDEPTNGLDPGGMADMRALIRRLGDDGRTVLLSSHMLGEVQQVCDRVGMIVDGRLVREGTVDEIRGGGRLSVQAAPIERARAVLEESVGRGGVALANGSLLVDAPEKDAARLNRKLVTAGVEVHALGWVERSLEQIFFEVTEPRGVGREN